MQCSLCGGTDHQRASSSLCPFKGDKNAIKTHQKIRNRLRRQAKRQKRTAEERKAANIADAARKRIARSRETPEQKTRRIEKINAAYTAFTAAARSDNLNTQVAAMTRLERENRNSGLAAKKKRGREAESPGQRGLRLRKTRESTKAWDLMNSRTIGDLEHERDHANTMMEQASNDGDDNGFLTYHTIVEERKQAIQKRRTTSRQRDERRQIQRSRENQS